MHVLRLYKDINNLLQTLTPPHDERDMATVIRRIIGRLKVLNTLGNEASWRFLAYMPLILLISDSDALVSNTKIARRLIYVLRSSLEKMIIGRTGHRLLRRKGIYVGVRSPATSLCVPSGFDRVLPGYEYVRGRIPVVITAVHATPPGLDISTGALAKRVASKTGAHALISKIPRLYIDANRFSGRILPIRRILERLVWEGRIRLILDIHSTDKDDGCLVSIGFWFGLSAAKRYVDGLIEAFKRHEIPYEISDRYYGGDIVFYHSNRPIVSAIQLEIASNAGRKSLRQIAKALSEYILSIGGQHGSKRTR